MITPSFGLTATERVLPKLALDFTTGLLDSRITFTRTTGSSNPATYVNSSGLITEATNNQPRFDYDPTTLLCKGLLIEESRTNLVLQSANASVSPWVTATSGVAVLPTVTPNAGVAPDGTNTAVRVQFDCTNVTSSSNRSRVQQAITVVNGTTYSKAIWLKAYDANSVGKTIRFVVEGIANTGVHTLTDQWVRFQPNAGASSTTSANFILETRGTFTTQTADVLLWNATLEAGAFLTSDIPTTTTALTRNADVATMTGTNFSDWFNATEGSAVIQALLTTISGTRPAIQFDDTTSNELIAFRGVAADPQLYVVDGGAAQATLDAGTLTANSAYRLGGAWKSANFAVALNGGATVSQLSGTYPTVTQLRLGSDGTNYFNGWLQNLRYWVQRVTNSETQAFSK